MPYVVETRASAKLADGTEAHHSTARVWVGTESRARELAAAPDRSGCPVERTWREVAVEEMPAKARARMFGPAPTG